MFTTAVDVPTSAFRLTYHTPVLTVGSCFAHHIGLHLQNHLFDVDVNPFGVLYNPLSVKTALLTLLGKEEFTRDDLFEHQSLWHSFAHSSLFSDTTPDGCLQRINSRLRAGRERLPDTRIIFITLGTASVYTHLPEGKVVANCHKLPADTFARRRLKVEEIVSEYRLLLHTMKQQLPEVQIIFTVSPIRHWKDGAHENNLSKATLLIAVDKLQEEFDNVEYFPAYELLLDELRDYRYYASDMIHPSQTAIHYIWERFIKSHCPPDTLRQMEEIRRLMTDLSHRPLHPDSAAYRQFAAHTVARKRELEEKYPFLSPRLKKIENHLPGDTRP